MQINEAMFVGSRGWVTKPGTMMRKGDEVVRKMKFIGEIVGISSCKFYRFVCICEVRAKLI